MAVRLSADGVIESCREPARDELAQLLAESGPVEQGSRPTRTEKAIADDYANV